MTKALQIGYVMLFIIFFSNAAIADEALSLKLGYQLLSPSGHVAVENNGIGSKVDLEGDLDLDNSSNMMAEAALSLGDFKITAGYLPLSFQGNSVLTRTISFDGKTYRSDQRVASSLDLDILDVGATWYFLNKDDTPSRLQLGVTVAAKITDATASLVDLSTQSTHSGSATVPIPTVGLRGRIALADFLGINGKIGYLGYGDNHFLDADMQLEFSPLPLTGIFAGYRILDVAIDESDIYVDADFSGFYGGAFIRF